LQINFASLRLDLVLKILECDIAVIGGGFGGVAAALAAAEAGKRVVMTEPTDWIGGQVTAQAVSPLDEHFYIESFGGSRAYYRYREGVRAWYRDRYQQTEQADEIPFNPGGGWVSRLCHEPRVALQVLEGMLSPHIKAGQLQILCKHTPFSAQVHNGRIVSVTLLNTEDAETSQSTKVELRAQYFLDASELGDLLALSGAPYVTGAETVEDTGEAHASKLGPQPNRVQSFTYSIVVENCPGENHIIRMPNGMNTIARRSPTGWYCGPAAAVFAVLPCLQVKLLSGPTGEFLMRLNYRRDHLLIQPSLSVI
jgi:hypothetical protein